MKCHKLTCLLTAALFVVGGQRSFSQGFVNLGFEDAVIVRDPTSIYQAVFTSSAVPGWSIYGNFLGPSTMLYNTATLSLPSVSIHDGTPPIGVVAWEGTYSLSFQAFAPVAIGQVGTLPDDAQVVTFWGEDPSFTVTFAGQPIALTVLSSTASYTVYGGNISAYAGQTGELRFQGNGVFDNIQFGIPEPSVFSLFGLGALLLGWHWHRKHSA